MKILNFSYNWNNKLNCISYTTLRLSDRFNIGDEIETHLNKKFHHNAIIIDKKNINIYSINNYIAFLDTGYDKENCINIIKKMYSKKNINWNTEPIYFYLIKKN